MKIAKLYLLVAALAVATACNKSQKSSAASLPPRTTAPPLTATAAPKPQAQPKAQPPAPQPKPAAPPSDPAADLIAEVDKQYKAGKASYQAGDLEAAKQNFEKAFNLLLSSKLDIHADERLEDELGRIMDSVAELDLQAEVTDAQPEQKTEPAPIDEANSVVYPVDPRLKAQAEAELKATHSDLPLMLTDPVVSYINYFSTRGRGTIESALSRSGRYHDMILRVLKEEGVPQDLIYLAQAESGFHPVAVSRAGARGMWQFMGSRAKGYGLERNLWVDDRQDPEKATRAAARHLRDLYNQFGDWYLAMAAYNSGPGTVQAAVRRTGYADYWELYKRDVLPKETRNYVPIIVAVTIMAKNPSQYGLDQVVLEKPIPYDSIKIDYPVDLRLVAECIDAPASDLQDLNPSLLRLSTPKDQSFELHLPQGTRSAYLAAIAGVPTPMRVWWRYHKVKEGETLVSVARTYRLTTRSIAQANELSDDQELAADSKLLIPIAPGKRVAADLGSYSRKATVYKIRQRDTVQTVADNFGVSPLMIRKWNHLRSDSLHGRRILYVHLPVTSNADATNDLVVSNHRASAVTAKTHPDVKTSSKTSQTAAASKKSPAAASASVASVHHKVKQGETLYSIATSYKTTVSALKHDNGDLAVLHPGMVLLIRDSQ